MQLTASQINLNRADLAHTELLQRLSINKCVFNFIQEPFTYKGKLARLPKGYDCYPTNSNTRPRAALFLHKSVKFTEIVSLTSEDCVVAFGNIAGKQTVVASIYMDILEREVVSKKVEDLMSFVNSQNYALIMGIDTNSHSILYGNETNRRGEIIEDFILTHQLQVENIGRVPTFQATIGQSIIDVTLTKNFHSVREWKVDQSFNGSDHNTITFEIGSVKQVAEPTRPWERADWKKFQESLRGCDVFIPEKMTKKKLDKLLRNFYSSINTALDKACPMTKRRIFDDQNTWFTEEIEELRQLTIRAYKTNPQEEERERFKLAKRRYRTACRRAKRRSWREFTYGTPDVKGMSQLSKIALGKKNPKLNTFTKTDGTTTLPGLETAEYLMGQHFPTASPTSRIIYTHEYVKTEEIRSRYEDWISLAKIRKALEKFESKKSPGPDGLKPVIFEHLTEEFLVILQIIYKSSVALSYTPALWKMTTVVFIPKPGKEDYSVPSAFRPISLSNYFLKGLERLAVWKMDEALVEHPIHTRQHGFRSDRSTETAISSVVDYAEQHVMNRRHCIGVFLDIKSAFDSIDPRHIKESLIRYGGDREMIDWYFDYLTRRDLILSLHGKELKTSVGVGFPQGGVASAKFWLVAFDKAVEIINSHGIHGNAFADDCAAIIGGTHVNFLSAKLQIMLNELTAWGRTCGLRFNPQKSVAVHFTRRRNTSPGRLVIDGKVVDYASTVKYLGVHLDKKLHWQAHILDKLTKAKRHLYAIASVISKTWGPRPQLIKWAFTGIIRPALTYASLNWAHEVTNRKIITGLLRLDRMALLMIAPVQRSTPTRGLAVIYNIMPTSVFLKFTGLKSFLRQQTQLPLGWSGKGKAKRHCTGHRKYWRDVVGEWGMRLENSDLCNIRLWEKNYRVNIDSFSGASKYAAPSQYNAYTDGSKLKTGEVGCGAAIYKRQILIKELTAKLPDSSTVFFAELEAIRQCAIQLTDDAFNDIKYVKFFVDSQAALRALHSEVVTSRQVERTVQALDDLGDKAKVTLVWTKSHVGTTGNEKADALARRGADSGPLEDMPIPWSCIKAELKECAVKQWSEEWRTYPHARQTKQFFPVPRERISKELILMTKTAISRLIKLMSGHNNLNYHCSLRDKEHGNACRFCEESEETFYHFVRECPRLIGYRLESFLHYSGPDLLNGRWNIQDILDFSRLDEVADAIEAYGNMMWSEYIDGVRSQED